jgi:hypothetical protein
MLQGRKLPAMRPKQATTSCRQTIRRNPRASGDPVRSGGGVYWMPAFAGISFMGWALRL